MKQIGLKKPIFCGKMKKMAEFYEGKTKRSVIK
jgi:hypothetical protein